MEKPKATYRLSPAAMQYISEIAAKNKISNTAALEKIIAEHKEFQRRTVDTIQATSAVLGQYLTEYIDEHYDKVFTRIRLAANNADRNSDVIIELLNGIYNFEEYGGLVSTKDNIHPGVAKAKAVVKERIASYRTAKLERERAKNNENAGDD